MNIKLLERKARILSCVLEQLIERNKIDTDFYREALADRKRINSILNENPYPNFSGIKV